MTYYKNSIVCGNYMNLYYYQSFPTTVMLLTTSSKFIGIAEINDYKTTITENKLDVFLKSSPLRKFIVTLKIDNFRLTFL